MKSSSYSSAPSGSYSATALSPAQNNLVSDLPANETMQFFERAERVECSIREVLFEINEPFERVLFPITGMASLVTVLRDGTCLEAMTVGREGFMGLPLFHGIEVARCRGMCHIEGEFYEMSPESFISFVAVAPRFRARLHRYAQLSSEVIAQTAACNAIHLIEQRCARWLLVTADAVGRTNFNVTQELLSQMLAVRRPGVTVAIGGLERQGLIEHRYGKVSIVDLEGLKKVACECYHTINEKTRELLG